MKRVTLGLLGAIAVATTALLVRQQRQVVETEKPGYVPAGETQPVAVSLERMRELGL